MPRRREYQSLPSPSEADTEICQREGGCHPTQNLPHHRLVSLNKFDAHLLKTKLFEVVMERPTTSSQSLNSSQPSTECKDQSKKENVRTWGRQQKQSNFTQALSVVNDLPEDEKSKLFLTIFRDLSFASKSTLLLDLLQECKDLKAAGQVSFQNIFIIFKTF